MCVGGGGGLKAKVAEELGGQERAVALTEKRTARDRRHSDESRSSRLSD